MVARRAREILPRPHGLALFEPPVSVEISANRELAVVDVPIAGDGTNDTSYDALNALRDPDVPIDRDPDHPRTAWSWIFQEGHLESLLGFESTGAVTSWLPLFLFVLLFGLSMDYHVFILSRVREAYDRGMASCFRRR